MRDETVVRLRHGLDTNGGQSCNAVLRGVTGVEEALFGRLIASLLPARAVTAILASTVERIGAIVPISETHVRLLCIGDRNRLMLALHRALYGNNVALVASCLGPNCGRTMDLDIAIDQLLTLPDADDEPSANTLRAEVAGRAIEVGFRLPNGEDQEAAATLSADDLETAADLMLRRTLVSLTAQDGKPVLIDDVLADLRQPLAAAFATRDPEAEIVLRLECPDCGHVTPADLDPYDLFRSRTQHAPDILFDIDRIARAYHWSEAEIMALPVARRRRYLAMIEAAGAPA
ncbi:MAG: hypothetical protein AB7P52_03690 [Alphaproteobacteria bacterium]